MSDLDAQILGPALFDITEQYTHKRYCYVEHAIGREAVLARHDYVAMESVSVDTLNSQLAASNPLSEGEWDMSEDLLTEAIPEEERHYYSLPEEGPEALLNAGESVDSDELDEVDPVGDAMTEFDEDQADRLGRVYDYRLNNVEPGTISLHKVDCKDGYPVITSLEALLTENGEVISTKTRFANDKAEKLELTAEDAEALALVFSHLQALNERQPHQA